MNLKEKITSKTARVGIIGLGYVGLPLAIHFAEAGFFVTGFDIDRQKAVSYTHLTLPTPERV